jgi:hypothetical protein
MLHVRVAVKWFYIVCAVLAFAFCLAAFRTKMKRVASAAVQTVRGRKTVADRVAEFGPTVEQRLAPRFRELGIGYPPKKVTLIGAQRRNKTGSMGRRQGAVPSSQRVSNSRSEREIGTQTAGGRQPSSGRTLQNRIIESQQCFSPGTAGKLPQRIRPRKGPT